MSMIRGWFPLMQLWNLTYYVMTLEVGYRQAELRWVWTVVEGVAGVKTC